MKIDNYILERLRADAAHTIAVAECEDAIQHPGLRGRLREILIANFLAPWLPPFCKCATGMIVESKNKPRKATQDDILVIDTSLAPPVLANVSWPEGVFLFNSVLFRIEVKSTITRQGLSDFIDASAEIVKMQFDRQPDCKTKFGYPHNILVAFNSDSSSDEWDFELNRFRELMREKNASSELSGFISAICVIDKGLWFLKDFREGERAWCRLDSDVREDRLVWLVAKASNTAFRAHAERQGRNPTDSLEVGIGSLLPLAQVYPVPPEDQEPFANWK